MHYKQILAQNLSIEIPLNEGQTLFDERLAQAIVVDDALGKLLHEEIDPDTYLQMIEPVIGYYQIDNYIDEVTENLLNARLH